MKIGYLGLGKMGKNMVLHLLEQGIEVVAWNRSPEPRAEVAAAGAQAAETVEAVVAALEAPRTIWIMLPAGPLVDEMLERLTPLLQSGDTIIDGGNSFYKDTERRGQTLPLHYFGIGVSGGPAGARSGACLMIGGPKEQYPQLEPLFKVISAPEAYAYLGEGGAGHFAKMVHNGIEYGMMQAIAEGAAVLQKSPFPFDLTEVFRIYNTRSVIESRLVGWAQEALQENPTLAGISPTISHTGEGMWTVQAAEELGVEAPVITESLKVREASATSEQKFRNRLVSALRGKFGQHPVQDADSEGA